MGFVHENSEDLKYGKKLQNLQAWKLEADLEGLKGLEDFSHLKLEIFFET